MALPPALLARLQKRGIIKDESEEVIAENYDSVEAKEKRAEDIAGAPGCPNKYNPYHMCGDFCYEHWGDGISENRLTEKYQRKRRRMLGKYPLPEGWVEVYDSGVGRHYYWCPDTDEVCWVSPRHPKAVIGDPAPRLAKELASRTSKPAYDDRDESNSREREANERRDRDRRRERDYDRDRDTDRDRDRQRGRKRKNSEDEDEAPSSGEDLEEMSDRDRMKRARKKGIDPMDPAAYGDAPVGSWASGLRADDKSGADVTASGPLFQMRPYPAPGAILRQQGKQKEDDE